MGRKAGVSAEQTRQAVLDAAAAIFGRKGYDGASIAAITAQAGVSSGAIYAHFGSKAELFAAVVRAFRRTEFDELLNLDSVGGAEAVDAGRADAASVITAVGASMDLPPSEESALMLEAVVASKRHPEVAELLRSTFGDGEALMVRAIEEAQAGGVLDPDADPAVIARFLSMVALGARMVRVLDLPTVDHDEWTALIARLVDSYRA